MVNNDLVILSRIRLDLTPMTIEVEDNTPYSGLGEDPDDFIGLLKITGPTGTIYENDDWDDPDFIISGGRMILHTVYIPLDPEDGYWPYDGQYTTRLTVKNTSTEETYEKTEIYGFHFSEPAMLVDVDSGPYSAKLRSWDNTNYGDNIDILNREHRIHYPEGILPSPPPDIVSGNDFVEVDPIYTNLWVITVSSTVYYIQPDELEYTWYGTMEVEHCVMGACVDSMYTALDTMYQRYLEYLPVNIVRADEYRERLIRANTAYLLLDIAWRANDIEEADKQAAIIQEVIELSGISTCLQGGDSDLVDPCPPWGGGGITPPSYTFRNGIIEAAGIVELGGPLVRDTTIGLANHQLTISDTSSNFYFTHISGLYSIFMNVGHSGTSESNLNITSSYLDLTYLIGGGGSRGYRLAANGIVEKADYSAYYTSRSLVSKQYVDNAVIASGYTFGSGLTEAGGAVTLGGVLSQNAYLLGTTSYHWRYREPGVSDSVHIGFHSDGSIDLKVYDLTDWTGAQSGIQLNENYVFLYANNAASVEKHFLINSAGMTIKDDQDLKGLEYFDDYSANWSAYSLVTMGWVQANFAPIVCSFNFTDLLDVPSAYTGSGGYFVKVNVGESALEFSPTGGWVPDTGGTFTGVVMINTSNDYPFIIRQSGIGGTPGLAEAGINRIAFQDGDGDLQGYVGIDNNGDLTFRTYVSGGVIHSESNFNVTGNITLTGNVDGIDLAVFYALYGTHTHTFASLTSKPTTLSGYGITNAMLNTANSWTTEFSSKGSAISGDYLVIEDSAAGYAKKYIQVGNLPTSATTFLALTDTPSTYVGSALYILRVNSTPNAVEFHDMSGDFISTADGTLNALTQKGTPISTDVLIIEDSASSYAQRKILWSQLPGAGTVYTFQYSIVNVTGTVNLVGDVAAPGATMYYGTNGAGTRGFYAVPAAGVHASSHEVGGGDLVNHDNLTGFVANEHIDWTGATSNLQTAGSIYLVNTGFTARYIYWGAPADWDTYIYKATDDNLRIGINSIDAYLISSSYISGAYTNAGALMNENATSGNPTLVPDRSDLTTGIGRNASAQLSMIISGSEKERITSTGSQIFGTLYITGKVGIQTAVATPSVSLRNSAASNYLVYLSSYTSDTGIIGIYEDASGHGRLWVADNSGVHNIELYGDGTSVSLIQGPLTVGGNLTNSVLNVNNAIVYTNSSGLLQNSANLTWASNQLIATRNTASDTTPIAKFLQSNATGDAAILLDAIDYDFTMGYDDSAGYFKTYQSSVLGTTAAYTLFVWDPVNFTFAIGSGTPSSAYKFYVLESSSTKGVAYFRQDNSSGNGVYILGDATTNSNYVIKVSTGVEANAFIVYGDGYTLITQYTGIGAAPSSSYKLYVYMDEASKYAGYFNQDSSTGHGIRVDIDATSGTSYYIFNGYAGASSVASLRADGTWLAADYQLSSDFRLKENIIPVIDGLKIALELNPINYTWKDKRDNYKHIGFIAQEVQYIRPELVSYDVDGYGSISYHRITAINTAAIHELNDKIEELKFEIELLKNGKGTQ